MVVFTKFYARSFELDSVTIFWEIEDISKEDDIYAFSMELFKSEAYNGPYEKVIGPSLINSFNSLLAVWCLPSLHFPAAVNTL
jgi:hypothetical protein